MKFEDGIVKFDDEEAQTLKFSEQAIMAIVMIVQKTFLDIAQDKGDKAIGDYLEESELLLKDGEVYITNPVTFSVDQEWLEGEEGEEDESEDLELIRTSMQYRN